MLFSFVVDSSAIPVIVGLNAGIAFVLIFILLSTQLQTSVIQHVGPSSNWKTFIINVPDVTLVTIPEGASSPLSDHNNFEPAVIKVVLGLNNTVRWINEDLVPSSVVADDESDPEFAKVTAFPDDSYHQSTPIPQWDVIPSNIFLKKGQTFQFTFTKPGEFGYHSVPHPHKHANVIVLPASGK